MATLPTSVTAGTTTGHLAHHNALAVENAKDGGALPQTNAEGDPAHDSTHHAVLLSWYNAAHPNATLPPLPSRGSPSYGSVHDQHHEALHRWYNNRQSSSGSTLLIGARAKDQDKATNAQLKDAFDRVNTLFGGLTLTRSFEQDLPAKVFYVSPPGVREIISYHNKPSDATLTTYVNTLDRTRPGGNYLIYHHEPEADYTTKGGGPTFITEFRHQYDIAKAAYPDLQFGMIAGGFQYNDGKLGADGSFIPPSDKCDWYGFDTYRTGESTGDTGFGALIPLEKVKEFQTWYGYVQNLGKPLYITEYGRGRTNATQAQLLNAEQKRPTLFPADAAYLKKLNFVGINLWYTDHSPGDDWEFKDQNSIDAWAALTQG